MKRTGKYDEDVTALESEVDRLRMALIAAGNNVGAALGPQVSTDFLMHVPEEIQLVVKRLRAEIAQMKAAAQLEW